MSLAAELLDQFEHRIETISLVPSDGGRFEVTVNDRLTYSKLQTNRHPLPGEIVKLVEGMTGS